MDEFMPEHTRSKHSFVWLALNLHPFKNRYNIHPGAKRWLLTTQWSNLCPPSHDLSMRTICLKVNIRPMRPKWKKLKCFINFFFFCLLLVMKRMNDRSKIHLLYYCSLNAMLLMESMHVFVPVPWHMSVIFSVNVTSMGIQKNVFTTFR